MVGLILTDWHDALLWFLLEATLAEGSSRVRLLVGNPKQHFSVLLIVFYAWIYNRYFHPIIRI